MERKKKKKEKEKRKKITHNIVELSKKNVIVFAKKFC